MKEFEWKGWVKPINQKKVPMYRIGFNLGDKFDGFHESIEYPDGRIEIIPKDSMDNN